MARNIAEGAAACSAALTAPGGPPPLRPLLLSAVGADAAGEALLASCAERGIDASRVEVVGGAHGTAQVAAVIDARGEIAAAVADVAIVEARLTPGWVRARAPLLAAARLVVLDANLGAAALEAAAGAAAAAGVRVLLEPVSVSKAGRCAGALRHALAVTPNAEELVALADAAAAAAGRPPLPRPPPQASSSDGDGGGRGEGELAAAAAAHLTALLSHAAAVLDAGAREWAQAAAADRRPPGRGPLAPERPTYPSTLSAVDAPPRAGVGAIVLTMGPLGAAVLTRRPGTVRGAVAAAHVPALPARVVALTGGGDALVAGMAVGLLRGQALEAALCLGVGMATAAVGSARNVPDAPALSGLRDAAAAAARGLRRYALPAGAAL